MSEDPRALYIELVKKSLTGPLYDGRDAGRPAEVTTARLGANVSNGVPTKERR